MKKSEIDPDALARVLDNLHQSRSNHQGSQGAWTRCSCGWESQLVGSRSAADDEWMDHRNAL